MLLFGLAHGSENFDCYPKRVLKNFYTNLLSLRQGGMSSFGLIETKNEKKVKQKFFSFHQVKNQFGHFGGPNPIFFFFLKIVLWRNMKVIFSEEKKIILRSLWFFEIKNFAARATQFADFFFKLDS